MRSNYSAPARSPQAAGVRVFFGHGVVERKTDRLLERNFHRLASFRELTRALRRIRVLTLAELDDALATPERLGRPAAVLTFDDGYANTALAWEILETANIPCVLFVSTGAIGDSGTVWTAELSLLLLHGQARQVDVIGRRWPLRDRIQREAAYQQIRRRLKTLPAAQRQEAMQVVREQFPAGETARLLDAFPAFRMLTWSELVQLAAAGLEIGSHGVYHEIHHALQPPAVRQRELAESRAALERRLRRPCSAFAFPNGDVAVESADEVRAAGYTMGFTIEPALVRPGANPYLLPRLKLAASAPTFLLDFLSGRGRPIRR